MTVTHCVVRSILLRDVIQSVTHFFPSVTLRPPEEDGRRHQPGPLPEPEIGPGPEGRPESLCLGGQLRSPGCPDRRRDGREVSAGLGRALLGGLELREEGAAAPRPANGRMGRRDGPGEDWKESQIWRVSFVF